MGLFQDLFGDDKKKSQDAYGLYSYMKDDEELGKKENINRKNKALLLFNDYSNTVSFFMPELLKLSKCLLCICQVLKRVEL